VAGRPPGSRVRLRALHWDGELPVAGDFLRTASGSCYLIEEARPGRGRTVAVFVCRKLEDDAVAYGSPGVHRWTFGLRR
jgi:hypothetical protein